MKTIEIGTTGILNGEILTVVSFNNVVFKCDNGKSYMIAKSTWMTHPEIIEAIANEPKKSKKETTELTEEQKERLSYLKATGNDMNSLMNKSTANYRNGKAGLSSLTK